MAIKKLPSTGDKPRSSHTPNGLPAGQFAGGAGDSAGQPWEGRTFEHSETAFADDDGSTPKIFAEAMERRQKAAADLLDVDKIRETGSDSLLSALAWSHADVLHSLGNIRVLVPLMTEAGDVGVTPDGKPVEKTQELAIVTVRTPDGRTAMPVFTSVEAMKAWDETARPTPVPGPQAAIAAMEDGSDLIVVDPRAETEFAVRATEVRTVALRQGRTPPWHDEGLIHMVRLSLLGIDGVVGVQMLPGDLDARLKDPEVDLVVQVEAGRNKEELDEVSSQASAVLQKLDVLHGTVDSMRMRLVSA